MKLPLSELNTLLTSEKTPILSLNGALPLSNLRDEQQTSGTGVVVDELSEFRLHHQSSGDFVRLQSQERGNYQPGMSGQSGIGIRLDTNTLSGDARAIWGYFEMNSANDAIEEGYLFGLDANGLFIQIIKSGVTKKQIYQDDFNIRSGYDIDLTKGHIFNITYTYYGYGQILFQFVDTSTDIQDQKQQSIYSLHAERLSNETSLNRVNLKIGALCDSTTGTADYSLRIGGRQISVVGQMNKRERINTGRVEGYSVTTEFTPVMTFRKKDGFEQIPISFGSINVLSDTDAVVQIRLNADITGGTAPNFVDLDEQPPSETALDIDKTADTVNTATGIKLYEGFVEGTGKGSTQGLGVINIDNVSLPDNSEITVCIKALSSSGTASVIASIQEQW